VRDRGKGNGQCMADECFWISDLFCQSRMGADGALGYHPSPPPLELSMYQALQ
jgi:hypothetical protein